MSEDDDNYDFLAYEEHHHNNYYRTSSSSSSKTSDFQPPILPSNAKRIRNVRCYCGQSGHFLGRDGQCPEGIPSVLLCEPEMSNSRSSKKAPQSREIAAIAEKLDKVEEEIVRDDIDIAFESYEEGNGYFNRFGAPDPLGVPFAQVHAEPIVITPDVISPSEAKMWEDVPIYESADDLLGRRGNKRQSMIPNFLGGKAGHRNLPANVVRQPNPISFFLMLLNKDLVDQFLSATNEYARIVGAESWTQLEEKEFLAFLVIIIFMGVVKLPDRTMYWQTDTYGQHFPQYIMSASRFEQILAHWNWIVVPENERAEAEKADPFYLVAGFVEKMALISQEYWRLDQFIEIDEMPIYYNARHKSRCYNPYKPVKWHFKAFCLNDKRTGYLWNYYLYHGASEVREEGWSATAYPIKKLTDSFTNKAHKGKNFIVCTKHCHTGFDIAKYLMTTYGIHFIGTIETNKEDLPKSRIFTDTGRNKKQRGDMSMVKTTIDGHDYYFTSWMDLRPVHWLSSLPTTKSTVQRKVMNSHDASYRTIHVPRPDMWNWHSCGIEGTDLHDEFNQYYRPTVRCDKWPIVIFTHFITSCVTNAYILFKSFHGFGTEDYSLKDFIMEIISDMAGNYKDLSDMDEKQEVGPDDSESGSDYVIPEKSQDKKRGNYKKRKKLPDHRRIDTDGHFARLTRSHQGQKIRDRGACRLCKAKVSTRCHKCDAFLCIDSTNDPTCFETFHMQPNI